LPEADPQQTRQPRTHEPVDGEIAARVPPPPRFIGQDIFFGTAGLRAGWSLLIYLALLWALLNASAAFMHAVKQRLAARTQQNVAAPFTPQSAAPAPHVPAATPSTLISTKAVYENEGVPLLCVVFATWIMAKIERRASSVYGLGGQRRLRNFLAGLGWGVALLSLLVFGLRATGLLVFDARLLFGSAALRYGSVWMAGFLLVGLLEEYLFRGYLLFTLARGINGVYKWLHAPGGDAFGFWSAAVLLSFGFGLHHQSNPGESPVGLVSAGLISVVFCLSLWRTGSLWWAIGFHASWDWAQSFLYGVADSGTMIEGHLFATHPVGQPIFSGGLTGPEGSLFILAVVALTAIVIIFTLPRTPVVHSPASAPQPSLH
jgi:uncharacterized protein